MKATVESYNNKFEVEIYFDNLFAGYGHWTIRCNIEFNGEKKEFRIKTTDSQFIDSLSEMDYNQKQSAYMDSFLSEFEEQIVEWCENVEYNEA
jgi:hypothetical protein